MPNKENNLKNMFNEFLWREVLSKHPLYKDVFESGKNLLIKDSKTIKLLINKLNEIDFDSYDIDILGEAYEKIFMDTIFGAGSNKKSELG